MPLTEKQTIINGKYRILRLIGEGGMARVWLAEELKFANRQVAIKEPRHNGLRPQDAQEEERRYDQEIEIAAMLEMAHVPQVVRAITLEQEENGSRLLVMEYAAGGSLTDRLLASPGGLPVDAVLRLAKELSHALKGFHALPIMPVHRDIKPSNILFDSTGSAYLADFGLCQLTGRSGRSQLQGSTHPGTPLYMAPEQGSSVTYLTPAADLYSLGCVLFEMLTGKSYKQNRLGMPASSVNMATPKWLDGVLAKMLAEDPFDRYQSADEMVEALQAGEGAAAQELIRHRNQEQRVAQERKRAEIEARGTAAAKATPKEPRHALGAKQSKHARNGLVVVGCMLIIGVVILLVLQEVTRNDERRTSTQVTLQALMTVETDANRKTLQAITAARATGARHIADTNNTETARSSATAISTSGPATPEVPTATVKPKATTVKTVAATIKPKATEKATATTKSTVAPTKVPSSNGSSLLPIGASLFSDDFSDPASGWAEGSNDLSEWGYLNGKYVITVHATKNLAWSFASQSFSDFVVEVTAAKVSGPADGEYGVLFRLLDNLNFYMFEVNATGSYFAAAYVNAEWDILIPWTKNSAIKTGAASNKLAVVAQGDTFGLYINGIQVDEFTDSTFTEGDVALLAGAQAVGELTAGFTNIEVWEVGEGASPTVEASGGISKGDKLYSETFADDATGWDTWDSANSVVAYEGGKYSIEVLNTDQLSWGNAYQYFDDFVIEVDATKVAGPDDGGFGIVLRYSDPDNFYYFVVTSDGQYRFSYYLDNKRTDIVPLTASDTVKLGKLSNKLSVACKGNHFILSINGQVVEDLFDDTFSSGDIGLLAIGSLAEAGTKVTFDNLNVWAVQ